MRPLAVSLLATWLLVSSFDARAAEESLPHHVAQDLKAAATQCTAVGGKPMTTKAIRRGDFNGDGKEDFILDVGAIDCEGAAGIYGDREKSVSVYVGDGAGGDVQVFSRPVFGVKVEGSGASARIWVTVMARECGKRSAKDFASESFCDRPLNWSAKDKKFVWAPVREAKMVQ
jgi:hypothetical protein